MEWPTWNENHETTTVRRILIAAITVLACAQLVTWLSYMTGTLLLDSRNWSIYIGWGFDREPHSWPLERVMIPFLLRAMALLLPWCFFIGWSRRLNNGDAIFFSRWPTPVLAVLALNLMAINAIIPAAGSPLTTLIHLPWMLWYFIVFGVNATPWGEHLLTFTFTLSCINALAFVTLLAVVGRYRDTITTARRQTRWLVYGCLWSFPIVLYLLNALGMRLLTGRGDTAEDFYRMALTVPIYLLSTGLVLASCGIWIWWCLGSDCRFKTGVVVAAVWALLATLGGGVTMAVLEIQRGDGGHGQLLFQLDYFDPPVQLALVQSTNLFLNLGAPPFVFVWSAGMAGIALVTFFLNK